MSDLEYAKSLLTQGIINVELWNAAQWRAVGFIDRGDAPPQLGLIFDDPEQGLRIFKNWRERIGPNDTRELIRISIIEGDFPGEAPGYSVNIGPNPLSVVSRGGDESEVKHFLLVSRVHRMNPSPGSNYLSLFKDSYGRLGRYELVPIALTSRGPQVVDEFAIEKRDVAFRRVEDIGPHDIDVVVLPNSARNPTGMADA